MRKIRTDMLTMRKFRKDNANNAKKYANNTIRHNL